MSRVIIIGNAEPEKDYTSLIKPDDFVIRFNKIQHFPTGLIGTHTDLMVFACNHSMRMHCYKGRICDARMCHFRTASRVWYRLSDSQSKGARMSSGSYPHQIRHRLCLRNLETDFLDTALVTSLMECHGGYKKPSTGFVVLNKLLVDREFADKEKYLCCLSGSYVRRHHNMNLERTQIAAWLEEGTYKLL